MWKRDKLFKKLRNAFEGNAKTKFYNEYIKTQKLIEYIIYIEKK